MSTISMVCRHLEFDQHEQLHLLLLGRLLVLLLRGAHVHARAGRLGNALDLALRLKLAQECPGDARLDLQLLHDHIGRQNLDAVHGLEGILVLCLREHALVDKLGALLALTTPALHIMNHHSNINTQDEQLSYNPSLTIINSVYTARSRTTRNRPFLSPTI